MKRFVIIVLLLICVAVFAAEQIREFRLRGWAFNIPSFLAKKVQNGPDFTVTYFSSRERKMSLGIYEGTSPQPFAKGRAGVREEQDEIGGQKVTWSVWEEGKAGERSFHAELFLLINSGPSPTERFHIFANASSKADLDLLRGSVRTGRRGVAANHAVQRMRASRLAQLPRTALWWSLSVK